MMSLTGLSIHKVQVLIALPLAETIMGCGFSEWAEAVMAVVNRRKGPVARKPEFHYFTGHSV